MRLAPWSAFTLAWLLAPLAGHAALLNPSFDADVLAPNTFVSDNPANWNVIESATGSIGLLSGSAGIPSPTHGPNHLYVNAFSGQTHSVWQTVLTSPLAPNTQYRIIFDVANRDRGNDGMEAKEDGDINTTVRAFFTLDGDNASFASAVGTPFTLNLASIANGTYLLNQMATFTTGTTNLNHSLNLVLQHTTTGATFSQSNWDNIRFLALPVPEPSTLGLLVLGGTVLFVARRRRLPARER